MDIKKLFVLLAVSAVVIACNDAPKSKVYKDIQEYSLVRIETPDLSESVITVKKS